MQFPAGMSAMTVEELIIREKVWLFEQAQAAGASELPASLLSPKFIKKAVQYPEQIKTGTAAEVPLKKLPGIQKEEVLFFSRGVYRYAYRGDENSSHIVATPGLFFAAGKRCFLYVYYRDRVVKMSSKGNHRGEKL